VFSEILALPFLEAKRKENRTQTLDQDHLILELMTEILELIGNRKHPGITWKKNPNKDKQKQSKNMEEIMEI